MYPLSRKQKQQLREFVQSQREVKEVRVGSDGLVRALGKMPGTSLTGWYLFGYADDLFAQINGLK